MGYQVPKKDHPWRKGWDKPVEIKKDKAIKKPVKVFVSEFVETWEEIEVITTSYQKYGRFKLAELPKRQQAAWLAGMLKRCYGI